MRNRMSDPLAKFFDARQGEGDAPTLWMAADTLSEAPTETIQSWMGTSRIAPALLEMGRMIEIFGGDTELSEIK